MECPASSGALQRPERRRWTIVKALITRRSWVQIPPPPASHQVRGPASAGSRWLLSTSTGHSPPSKQRTQRGPEPTGSALPLKNRCCTCQPLALAAADVDTTATLRPQRLERARARHSPSHIPASQRHAFFGLDYEKISSYSSGVRRKPGQLLGLEVEILTNAAASAADGEEPFHGFAMAKRLREQEASRRLTGHGTLYKALARLEDGGLLESWWEDPQDAQDAGRPRRRLYRITSLGQAALAASLADRVAESRAVAPHPRIQPV
jgi:PadR family transcriptional regulator PadR